MNTSPHATAAYADRDATAPPALRWALYEAAQSATRRQSPDYADYHALKALSKTGFHGEWVCRFLLLVSQLVLTP